MGISGVHMRSGWNKAVILDGEVIILGLGSGVVLVFVGGWVCDLADIVVWILVDDCIYHP